MKESTQVDMLRKRNYFDREITDILKGVAIIFMFAVHFFTLPELLAENNPHAYPAFFHTVLNRIFEMCVAIFAFITGYCYVFTKKKSIGYSLKKATDLWVNYFVFFVLLLIPAVILKCWDGSAANFLLEAFALKRPTMTFCWYVVFYVICMLLLPLYHLAAKKHILAAIILGIIVPSAAQAVYQDLFYINNAIVSDILYHFFTWLPCIVIGYICAEYELFYRCMDFLFKKGIKSKALQYIIYLCAAAIGLAGRYLLPEVHFSISAVTIRFSMDMVYTPLFVYGLINLVDLFPWKKIWAPIALLGKHSMGMWFVHCIFFNSCKEYTQTILYFPNNPILILLWGLLLCLAAAFVITKGTGVLVKWKNRLLFKKL